MDFGQFYLEKLNAVIAELSKEKITLQCQLEFMIKKHEALEQEFKELLEKNKEQENSLTLSVKEIEKLKKKINKENKPIKEQISINNGEIKQPEQGVI